MKYFILFILIVISGNKPKELTNWGLQEDVYQNQVTYCNNINKQIECLMKGDSIHVFNKSLGVTPNTCELINEETLQRRKKVLKKANLLKGQELLNGGTFFILESINVLTYEIRGCMWNSNLCLDYIKTKKGRIRVRMLNETQEVSFCNTEIINTIDEWDKQLVLNLKKGRIGDDYYLCTRVDIQSGKIKIIETLQFPQE